jgi:hypothetical protein
VVGRGISVGAGAGWHKHFIAHKWALRLFRRVGGLGIPPSRPIVLRSFPDFLDVQIGPYLFLWRQSPEPVHNVRSWIDDPTSPHRSPCALGLGEPVRLLTMSRQGGLDEAARFRGMVDDADRPATPVKVRR